MSGSDSSLITLSPILFFVGSQVMHIIFSSGVFFILGIYLPLFSYF
jgi:hypothetical protein